jgi:hypothetical protein
MLGREVEVLVNETRSAGRHTVQWNASTLPSGIYISRLNVRQTGDRGGGNQVRTIKMVLIK